MCNNSPPHPTSPQPPTPNPSGPQFGVCQDCYMPKEPSKQGHRGIGFVTYANPESGVLPPGATQWAASCSLMQPHALKH